MFESFNISASEIEVIESFSVSQRQKSVRDESRLWSGQEEQVNCHCTLTLYT